MWSEERRNVATWSEGQTIAFLVFGWLSPDKRSRVMTDNLDILSCLNTPPRGAMACPLP
jgi:hypothetical protein